MVDGLSERDKRLLAEGRELAARARAEWQESQRREQRERERYGPLDVVGPDGVTVRLTIHMSGDSWGGLGSGGGVWPDELWGVIALLALIPIIWLFSQFMRRRAVRRNIWIVTIKVPRRKAIELKTVSRPAAGMKLRRLADKIRREGVAALPTAK